MSTANHLTNGVKYVRILLFLKKEVFLMNTTKVESALAVMAIIILCVLFYNHNQLNNLIVKTVKNETRIQNNADLIRRNVNSINTNAVAIESNKKSIKSIWRDCKNTKNKIAEIQKLQQDLEKQNVAKIQKLQQDLEKLKKIETLFKTFFK